VNSASASLLSYRLAPVMITLTLQIAYDKRLASPYLLTKNDLAEHVRQYVAAFNLNVINSAEVLSTQYNTADKQWTVKFQTPTAEKTIVSKQLVQATGIGSQKAFVPPMKDEKLYKGVSLHSSQYKSASELKARGIKVSINYPTSGCLKISADQVLASLSSS
jgi:hypothetical protein